MYLLITQKNNSRGGQLDIAVGEVVRWGEENRLGVVKKIRIINSAKLVESFSGDPEEVILSVEDLLGSMSVWAKKITVQKAEAHESKEFKVLFKKNS